MGAKLLIIIIILFTFEMRAGPMTELTFSTAFRTPVTITRQKFIKKYHHSVEL